MKADIEELKANSIEEETEQQGISEENEGLTVKCRNDLSCQREYELGNEPSGALLIGISVSGDIGHRKFVCDILFEPEPCSPEWNFVFLRSS
ncbi:hypothetical protein PVL29_015015 [Vitis rotundifolia]|uniref:Uncharacterized protein n=1 Tax=Vitis rotundifolia TaxID=103349 RepID=A0AA38ZBG1_VITRO|nr:hypothetical protein PVL29_015015 [Vitis rotundifolia]